jgi:trimeric autotransporter adhesin
VKSKRPLPSAKSAKPSKPKAVAQALEARVLFSADVTAIALSQTASEPTAQVHSQPSNPIAANTIAQTPANSQLFVIDLRIADSQGLLAGLEQQQAQARANGEIFEILTLDWQDDGITKIRDALSAQGDVSTLHLIGHGDDGMMLLGSTWLDQATLRSRAADFSTWSNGLSNDADILVYGCDFAGNDIGQQSVKSLAQITGADVAASTDTTANIAQHGNWNLEYQTGAIEASTASVARAATQWQGKLATFVVTNNSDAGSGSLRQAILDANANLGIDTITVNVGGSTVQVIGLQSELPAITEGVLIDGTTQFGYTPTSLKVELSGTFAGGGANGLTISSNEPVTIRGLIINNFAGHGIVVNGGGGNVITGNIIGLDSTGTAALSNGSDGIKINNSVGNLIGGTTAAERNIVSGNIGYGIFIGGASDATFVRGNYIGTDITGNLPLGNTKEGVIISLASNVVIGGANTGEGNVISANIKNGVGVYGINGSATNNTVLGNIIGLNASGTNAVANGESGIAIGGASASIIGGTSAGAGNVISGNTQSGIYIDSAINNRITNNWIGLNATNTGTIGNGSGGIYITGNSFNNKIGGLFASESNVITGSGYAGVIVGSNSNGNSVLGNIIYGNARLGIDLGVGGGDGVTANDASPDADTGANDLQNYPVVYTSTISGANVNIIGELRSSADTAFLIQFYGNINGTQDASSHCEGRIFLGTTTVNTDSTGLASFNVSFASLGLTNSDFVSTLATVDLGSGSYGNTSEFSLNAPVTTLNVAPSITNLGGDLLFYTEGDGALAIDVGSNSSVSDSDSSNFDTGTLTVSFANGSGTAEDRLAIQNQGTGAGQIGVAGASISYGGITIGSFTGGNAGAPLSITFNSNANTAAATALIRAITFENINNGDPSTAAKPITLVLTDGDGGTSATYNISVSVAAVNDAPSVLVSPGNSVFVENGPAILIDPLSAMADVDSLNFDGGILNITIVANGSARDVLGIRNQGMGAGQIGLSGSSVFFGGTLIGTYSNSSSIISILLNANATKLETTALMRNLTFNVIGQDPLSATRQAIITLSDGDGGTGTSLTKNIDINVDSTLWVNTTSDAADGDTSSIFNLLANRGADGVVSLREAIIATNNTANTGQNQINFDISGTGARRINLASALPEITKAVLIDGGSQTGYANSPLVEINGSAITEANGLTLAIGSNGSTIRGLSITNFLGTASPGGHGIVVFSNNNVIQSNFIGLDTSGNAASNWVGLVVTDGAKFNLIGGTTVGQGNVISGNTLGGISIGGVGTSANRIEGNLIGVAPDSTTPMPNTYYGVNSWASGDGNTLGGTFAGAGNTISGNSNVGVVVQANSTLTILGNSISGNFSHGIDLANDGLTPNDLNDTDLGANSLQNYPVISSVTSSGGSTTIIGNFNTSPSQTFRLEYFSSPTADASGYGGGKTLIGYSTIISGTDGNANINLTLGSTTVPVGYYVSATATRDFGSAYGGTSEFAKSVIVSSVFPGATVSPPSGTVTSESGTSVTFTVRLNTAPTGTVTIPISSDKFWEGNVNAASLTFTTANWNIDQTITVSGVDDSVVDGSHGYNIVFGNAVSTDPAYNFMKLADIAVNNIDNDFRSIVVVNTATDTADGDTSSLYALIRNLGADGKISLREAIQAANNTPNGFGGADEIQFNIADALVSGEHVITLNSALPTITDAIVINGSSDPAWASNANRPVIVINGNDIVTPTLQLNAFADNSSIIGLIIRNSGSEGILIDAGSDNNTIIGNYIGALRSDGTAAGASSGNVTGIYVNGAGNRIGGINVGDRNVISGNSYGIVIGGTAAMNNLVAGNYVGTTASGNSSLGNTFNGIQLQQGATYNTIGGNTAAHRNVISGNLEDGIEINGETTDNNTIRGNHIGVSADGLNNITPVTNLGGGIYVASGADNTIIGGSNLGQGNWIAGSHYAGIDIEGMSNGTIIQGNRIGTDATGLANWGTGYSAIILHNGAANTLIGGTTSLAGNLLAFSGQISPLRNDAITILDAGVNNAALGNTILNNVGLGIDLDVNGVNAHDLGDSDAGANSLQNYPVLTTALTSGGSTTITGSLNSIANTNYRIEFFSSETADTSGHGEAGTFLGFVNVTTDAAGNTNFSTLLSGISLLLGDIVTATATVDLGGGNYGSTSEFSTNISAGASLSISGTVYEDINSNGQVADDGVGLSGARVSLYLDNGDGVIGAGDTVVNIVSANSIGRYSFNNLSAGTYWVVADSRTFISNSGLNAGNTLLDQWGEQTYGSTGSVSWNAGSYSYSSSSGTFLGGMRSDRSDNGASLATAEHVTKVSIAGLSVSSVDYGFSFNVITNARDGDDVAANNLTIQGSLRQFVQNSNALIGVQSSQFRIPASDPKVASGVAVISLTSALPTLTDTITIDGTTQTTWGGNTNAAILGTGGFVGYNPVGLGRLPAPEIEIRDLTTSANIFKILGNGTVIRGLSILGGGVASTTGHSAIEVSANNVTIAGNIIGSSATGIADAGAANRIQSVGVRVLGQATIDNNIFAYIPMHAVSVEAGGSNSSISNNEFVAPALTSNTQAAIAVRDVSNVQIIGNLVRNSGGNSIELFFNADNNIIRNNSFLNGGALPGGDDNAIDITGGSDNNLIEGNLIDGNAGAGIFILGSAGNKIGGVLLAQGNQIINNGGSGVILTSSALGNQSILGNSIHNNSGLGIDLGNDSLTVNDGALDADSGPNGLQNFPVLSQVISSGGNTSITGAISSTANTTFRIEFYSATVASPTGYGQGQTFLGFTTVTTDASGIANISMLLSEKTLAANTNVSATATVDFGAGSYGNTSEFSQNTLSQSPVAGVTVTPVSGLVTTEAGGTAQFSVVLQAPPTANVTINLSSSNNTEGTLSVTALTFTATNWNIAQVVTVTGLDDRFIDGNVAYAVNFANAISTDPSYSGLTTSNFLLTNTDNETYNTLVVDTTSDASDGDTSSIAALWANKGADGRISLREAILAANNTTNGSTSDKIIFDIRDPLVNGVHTISLLSSLPSLSDSVFIDGATDPDFSSTPVIALSGISAGAGTNGLNFVNGSAFSGVRSLIIDRFSNLGISVSSAANVEIGGIGFGNVITRNTNGGINVDPGSNNIRMIGNAFGTDLSGAASLANGSTNIRLLGGTDAVIGGTAVGEGNLIANSVNGSGISVSTGSINNAIIGNAIYNNFGLGIELGSAGVQPNDSGDGDSGANGLQNYPVLISAVSNAGTTTIAGTFNSNANTNYRIEFFSSPTGDGSGFGEARTLLGFVNVSTDASGNATFNANLVGVSVVTGTAVSATATVDLGTGSYGSTSELAQNVLAIGAPPGVNVSPPSTLTTTEAGTVSQFTVVLNAPPSADVTITLSVSDASEASLSTSTLVFTAANWNIPQLVTVTGLDDSFIDGNVAYSVITSNVVSTDLAYSGMVVADVALTNFDNDPFNILLVDTTSDIADGDTSSIGALYANKGADGKISLREAILAANNTANGSIEDRISFNIPDPLVSGLHTINVLSALPTISDAIFIDGTSEPDFGITPVVELNGSGAGAINGLVVSPTNGSRINGLSISRINLAGIQVIGSGFANVNISNNRFTNQSIGVAVSGTANGVLISQNQMDAVGQLIDLGSDGITPNDLNDLDTGPNGLQNTATLTSISTDGLSSLRLTGNFNGIANQTFTVDVYEHGTVGIANRSRFAGTFTITTDASGNVAFNQVLAGTFANGTLFSVTVTASAASNATSEHSTTVAAISPAVIATPIAGLVVNEGGTSASFSMVLSTAPIADVVITLSANIAGEVSLSSTIITFTAVNWNVAQFVTVTGLQDLVSDGNQVVTILTSTSSSSDLNYNNLFVNDVVVTNNELPNQAPQISAPLSYTAVEDATGVLGAGTSGIVLSDLDAGNNQLDVTLTISNGVFSLGTALGLIFSIGDGSADSSMTFRGTVAQINAAINSITFSPTANFAGVASLNLFVNDLGNSGSGGALGASRSVPINVVAVNDAPILSGTKAANVLEGGTVLITPTMLNLTDIDNTTSDLIFTIRSSSGAGEFMRSGVSLRSGDSFSQADINAQLIQFSHFGGELPTASMTLGASERLGIFLADFAMNFNVLAVNDAPTIAAVNGAAIPEIAVLGTAVATVTATDVDNSSGFTFSLTDDAQGAFKIDPSTGAITVNNPAKIDFETAQLLTIRVKVADPLGASVEREYIVQITDFPELVITSGGGGTSSSGGGTAGTLIIENSANGTPSGTGNTKTNGVSQGGGNVNSRSDAAVTTSIDTASKPVLSTQDNDAKRGSQTKIDIRDKDVWVDPNSTTSSGKKKNENGSRLNSASLAEQQEVNTENSRRRTLHSDSLDYLLNNKVKAKNFSVAPPAVFLANFKLPENAQSMPIREDLIDKPASNKTFNVVIDTIEYSGMALSVGAVAWATRTGGLLAALLSAIPAWKGLDPLLVLSPSKSTGSKAKDFEEFTDTEIRSDEEAVRAVL